MKKTILTCFAVVAFAATMALNVNLKKDETGSNVTLTLENIEALAQETIMASCVSGGNYCYLSWNGGSFESNVHKPGASQSTK